MAQHNSRVRIQGRLLGFPFGAPSAKGAPRRAPSAKVKAAQTKAAQAQAAQAEKTGQIDQAEENQGNPEAP